MGFLDTQSNANNVEAMYVAYFGRGGDGPGYLYWNNQLATEEAGGTPESSAVVNVADAFAVQPEATSMYSFLASPPATLNPTDPVQIAGVDSFINQIYQNLFNRAADTSGLNYWQTQILSGAVSVGSAVYAIANGALGADQSVLADKITAASYFTQQTYGANLDSGSAFLAAAHASVAGVVDSTTLNNSESAVNLYVTTAGTASSALTLTPGQDTLSTSQVGAVFNAPLVNTSFEVAAASFNVQTLTTGDTLNDSSKDGTLNATLNANTVGAGIVANVTMAGIATANLTNVGGFAQGFEGNVTGLTTVNDSNSNAGIQLGVMGAGLNTALTNVAVTGYTGANGSAVFSGIIAASAGSASNTINVSLSGNLGGTGAGLADVLTFSTDGPVGTKASPNVSYGTWALTVNSNADLELSQNGVGGATALTIAGAGAVALGSDLAGNWQNLTSIDASGSTGNVTITGHSAGMASNAAATPTNLDGLFGSVAGLLDGNTSLTSYKLSSGINILDVSSLSSPTKLAQLTTTGAVTAGNEIIVSSADADTTSSSTFANIAGFAILGIVAPGSDTGTITWSNLPSSVDDVLYQTTAVGALTISSAPASLTVDTGANGAGEALSVTSTAASSDHIIVGSSTFGTTSGTTGVLGDVTLKGVETVDFTAHGPSADTNFVGSVSLTPASASGSEAVTIDGGSHGVVFGDGASGDGAIFALQFGSTTALLTNHLSITDSNTGVTDFFSASAGPLAPTILPGDTTLSPVYSTNALTIDAHASGGLIMHGGDANFSTTSNAGDTIIGSTTGSNILIGSIGNDTITGTSSLTAPDTIDTGGGADTITLAAGHTVGDAVDLYGGSVPNVLGNVPGNATNASFGTVVDGADNAQLGWWGIGTSGVAASPTALFANGTGTSADMSTVADFLPASHDSVNISVTSFAGFLYDVGLPGFLASPFGPEAANFSASLAPGGTVPTGISADVLLFGTPFANANALASSLSTGGTAINIPATVGTIEHFLAAYQDLSGNVRIADVDLHAPVNTTTTGGADIVASDMVQLTGVSIASLTAAHTAAIHFVA